MKKLLASIILTVVSLTLSAQNSSVLDQIKADPKKSYGNDYPYLYKHDTELMTGISELTQLGWEQHQGISRRMFDNFPEIFAKGGNVLAISSLSGRCVLSMAAFCQELVQCNPKIEIREQ